MDEQHTHKMAAGKSAVAARTRWQLQVGPVAFRCLKNIGGDEVQVRDAKGWKRLGVLHGVDLTHYDAATVLRMIVASPVVRKALGT